MRNDDDSHDSILCPFTHGRVTWVWLIVVWSCTIADARDVARDRWDSCGLQLMWQGQTAADGFLGTVEHVVLHVSSTRSREIVEVVAGEQRTAFVPEDLDRFGRPLGVEGAARQADIQKRTLEAQGKPATIENRQVPESILYVQTSLGMLQAIQAETGHLRWDVALGSARAPSIPPSVDDQYLLANFGTTFTLLDPADGRFLWQRPIANIPGNFSAILNEKAWIPRLRGTLDVFSLSAPGRASSVMMSIGRVTTPLSVSPVALVWTTDAGYLYIVDPVEGRMRSRLRIRDLVSAPLTQDRRGNLYVATEGGLVLSVDSNTGKVRWQNLVDGAVHQAPLLLEDAVCLATTTGWLVCLDAASGELRWQRHGVRSWVARGNRRVFAVDVQNDLAAIDATTGNVDGKSPLRQLRPLLPQGMTDRVFLTNGYGQIVALRPMDQPWTNIYVPLKTQADEAVETAEEQAPDEQVEPSPPESPSVPEAPLETLETDDPFGAEFDNPFE